MRITRPLLAAALAVVGLAQFAHAQPSADELARIKVDAAYRGILGREADREGLEGYVSAILGWGMTTAEVCDELFRSVEFAENRSGLSPEDLAAELYHGILCRESDPEGLQETIRQIRSGHRVERAAAMIDSSEFAEHLPKSDDAELVSVVLPSEMASGGSFEAKITVRNTGCVAWTAGGAHRLGAVDPNPLDDIDEDPLGGPGRVLLSSDVPPKATYKFEFDLNAPSTSESLTTAWQMLHEDFHWFGPVASQVVAVGGDPCIRTDASSLSPVAAEVLNKINQQGDANSSVPLAKVLSTCNRFDSVRVNGPAIFAAARDIIALAEREVDIVFFRWHPDSNATRLIGEGLIAAQARRTPSAPLLVRIVIDDTLDGIYRDINHIYDAQKRWVSLGLDTSRVTIQLATSPRDHPTSSNLHDKIIVVDAKHMLTTGSQPELTSDPLTSDHDSGWHDSGYVLEGDAAQSALAAFEHTWTGDAIHWECKPRSVSQDCQEKFFDYPQPDRTWLPAFGSQRPGNTPVLAVGRIKGDVFSNGTNNPQDQAWLTMIDRATSQVNVESPNINDDGFRDAVVRAVGRGVTVRLITSLGFNDFVLDGPALGGDNMEVVADLRQRIRAISPASQGLFKARWYSQDAVEPVMGNGSGASHTKYITTDDSLAMVGSGNMDTLSWNASHEFNVLIDDAQVTTQVQNAVFLPDWYRAVTSYVELYEGYNGNQDIVCVFGVNRSKSVQFKDTWGGTDYRCNNDEARSALLHDIPAGARLFFYDSPDGGVNDDWTEIHVKRAVSRKYIGSFETSLEDSDVKVTYHPKDGLDGKVSYARVVASTADKVIDLLEGSTVPEGDSEAAPASFTVSLGGPLPTAPVSISYATVDGTALAGSDYVATAGILTFTPGESIKTILVPVLGDLDFEPDETFTLTLSNPTPGVVLGTASAVGTILNDDVPPPSTLTVALTGTGSGTVRSVPAGIDCGADCSEEYPADTAVTLTATPAASSTFSGWSGDCSGAAACVVTMSRARSITAAFAGPNLAITVDDGLGVVLPGAQVSYTITLKNLGNANVLGARVSDTFPAELGQISWSSTDNNAGTGDIDMSVDLPASGSIVITATGTLTPSTAALLSNSAHISVPAGSFDRDPSDNSATDTDQIGGHWSGGVLRFHSLPPCRLVDTRGGGVAPIGGPILQFGQPRALSLAGFCGIPSSARALSVSVTVTQPSGPGWLRLTAKGDSTSNTTTVNFQAATTRASNAIVPVVSGGMAAIVGGAPGTVVHMILDVNGYFGEEPVRGGVNPAR